MLLTKTRPRRIIAATLAMLMLSNIVLPTVTYALTSGPTAPEATSFEPIDTTDMVNLQTGDFTYNMPLLEVPGPEGGYPLSLSYHAGIQPNEDASWVGLGWTLNPGAVNRNVNSFPDDWTNPATNSQTYLEAGVTTTYNVGVNIGIANTPVTVGAGLSFSQDTYRGFGLGGYASLGKTWQLGDVISIKAEIGIGMSPYGGDDYAFGGVSANFNGSSVGIGFQTNFESLDVGFSGSMGTMGLLGISMGTKGGKPSFNVGGMSWSANATQQAGVQTKNTSFSVDIPVYYFNLSLGYSKQRYWIDKSTDIVVHGSLHGSGWTEGTEGDLTRMVEDDVAYDAYSLLEDPKDKSIIDNPDPNKVQGGAYPDFDNYSVTGQGLGGNMRPYLFQGEVLGQNKKNSSGDKEVNYYSPSDASNAVPQFRFVGDFSNSFRQELDPYTHPEWNLRLAAPPFATPTFGNDDGSYGYSGNKLAGSRHIDIGPSIKPGHTQGYVRADRYTTDMIEGFSITNESGLTYHYGLPAYSWDEENYQEKIRPGGTGQVYLNRGHKFKPYAYTWYLTTITGPDFVDRNSDGMADENDWGYWVNFEYGKWSNNYVWRNPAQGFHRDEDNEFQNCSMGRKEVYYLNAIRTRTHIAIFEKDIRKDGKGSSPEVYNRNTTQDYQYPDGVFNVNSSQSLRLNKIYLLNASDADFVSPSGGSYTAYRPTLLRTVPCSDCELAANVIDKTDVDASNRNLLEAKAIRVIDFNYNYSLSPSTINSYDINSPSQVPEGKLTLKYVALRGKTGISHLPPTKFEYELSGDALKTQTGVTVTPTDFTTTNATFEIGDLLGDYGIISKKEDIGGGTYKYSLVNNMHGATETNVTVSTTKNPRYNKDYYDLWGMYKSDADVDKIADNENSGRLTTSLSGKSVDVWSLRKIISSTGSTLAIEYESKMYKSVLNSVVGLNAVIQGTSGNVELYFPNTEDFLYASSCFAINDKINFVALYGGTLLVTPKVMDTRKSFPGMKVSSMPLIGTTIFTNIPYSTFQDSLLFAGSFQLANVFCGKESFKPGDGIRIKQITVSDNTGSMYTTLYNYTNPLTGRESGVSTYDPSVFDMAEFPSGILDAGKKLYKAALFKEINGLLAISREVPPPGVIHEYVTVTTSVKNVGETLTRSVAGSTQYQFEVFRENMILKDNSVTPYTHHETSWGTMDSRNIVIKKFLQNIGAPRRVTHLDKDGRKLSEIINHYLHDGLESDSPADFFEHYKARLSQFSYQGFLQERYSEAKTVDEQGWTSGSQVKATMSAREDYPSIATGQTAINYVNGTQTTSENLAYDFYSGALTKSVETDSYGNRFMTETTPAYRKYSAMGLKVNTGSNKNMLTQTAGTTMYKVDATNTPLDIISSNADVWSNAVPSVSLGGTQLTQNGGTFESKPTGNVWRLQSSYSWMPVNVTTDGLTPYANFSAFNYTTPSSSDANWKKTSEITLNDVYSKALEAEDMNGNYAATRMNYGSRKVELTGSPSGYYEIAYSGAEDDNINQTANGFVKKVDGTVVSTAGAAHTGGKSLKLGASGKKGFVYTIECNKLTAGRDYMASVWVKPVSGIASDVKLYYDKGSSALGTSLSSESSTKAAGDWKLINLKISGSDITTGATINIGCRNDHGSAEAYVDDFRFQPLNATTSAYVYDAFSGELSHILDNSNLYTRFEYDGAGRLTATYRERLGVGEYKTNEYQQNFSTTKFISAPIDNETYARIGCPTGYNGSTSSITVPEGRFVSFISQADANAQADAYAQSEANRLGTCTPAGNIQLRNNIAADAEYYSDALLNKVDFIQGSTVVYTFSWPSGADTREAFTYVSVAPGTYTLRFYVDVGEPETARYYGFKPVSPTNLKWTRSQHDLSYTTYNTVTVSTGVSYTLTVASSSALAD